MDKTLLLVQCLVAVVMLKESIGDLFIRYSDTLKSICDKSQYANQCPDTTE